MTELRAKFSIVRKYKAIETDGDDISTFTSIHLNVSETKRKFEILLKNNKVFNCVTNKMELSEWEESFEWDKYFQNAELLESFYETLFPVPSQYELPAGTRCRYQFVNEYRYQQKCASFISLLILAFLCLASIALYFNYRWWKQAVHVQKKGMHFESNLIQFKI